MTKLTHRRATGSGGVLLITCLNLMLGTGAAKAADLCWSNKQGEVKCVDEVRFRSLSDAMLSNESTSTDQLNEFRQSALTYRYSGDFRTVITNTVMQLGHVVDPSSGLANYVLTDWVTRDGRMTLLGRWKERRKFAFLFSRNPYDDGAFDVMFGCSVQESPNGRDWVAVSTPDIVTAACNVAKGQLNSVAAELGSRQRRNQ